VSTEESKGNLNHHGGNSTGKVDLEGQDFIEKYFQCKIAQDYEKQDVMEDLEKENDLGNREYKLKLVNPTDIRIMRLATQMKFRIQEGKGEAFYEIGIKDNGEAFGLDQKEMICSLRTLYKMAKSLDAELSLLNIRKGKYGETAQLMVREKPTGTKTDIKIILLGEVTSGKSTLLGVMVSGEKDNGEGLARQKAFKHAHTLANGQECTIHHQILGFDAAGKITNMDKFHNRTWDEIYQASYKVVTFIDAADNPSYIENLSKGVDGCLPNYAMI
jgi:GTPase